MQDVQALLEQVADEIKRTERPDKFLVFPVTEERLTYLAASAMLSMVAALKSTFLT